MTTSTVLSAAQTAATSSDFIVAAGQPVRLAMTASTTIPSPVSMKVFSVVLGVETLFATLSQSDPGVVISAAGTYRIKRPLITAFGVSVGSQVSTLVENLAELEVGAASGSVAGIADLVGGATIGFGSSVVGASKIRKFLSAIGKSAYQRVNIGYQSHSIGLGVDATDAGTYNATTFAAWHTRSQAAIVAKRLSASSGTTACGANMTMGGTSGAANPLLTVGGGMAAPSADYIFGASGWRATLSAAAHTMSFTAVGTSIRVYAVCSGANSTTQARWSAPSVSAGATQTAAVPAGGNTPANDRTFYEFTVGPVVPGEVVTLMGPTTGVYSVYYIDLDYQPNTAGVTVHRLCQSGASLVQINAAALDSTDTQGPAASWLGSSAGFVNARLGQAQSMSVRVPQDGVILQTDVNDLNDWTNYGYTLADMQRHLANYLAYQASINVPVLVVFGTIRDPSYLPGTRPYDQAALIEAYKSTVNASSQAAYIDLTAEFKGATLAARYNSQVAAGFMQDIVHPNSSGHGYWGSCIANALLACAANRY